MYTALYGQTVDGTPVLNPMFYLYPNDENTFGLELQFFYGDALLVAPVTEENSTSVDIYLPKDVFYDWYTGEKVVGEGSTITVTDQGLTDIPLYLRGGVIVPLRTKSGMTTSEVREQDFELVVALNADGKAQGKLYLDDGVSLVQKTHTLATFSYENCKLQVDGHFGYETSSKIVKVTILGDVNCGPSLSKRGPSASGERSDAASFDVDVELSGSSEVKLGGS